MLFHLSDPPVTLCIYCDPFMYDFDSIIISFSSRVVQVGIC